MKYFLNILFLIFTGSVLGSEQNNEIYQFTAYVRENQPLVSCDKEYIDSFNETYGTQYKYEDPFLPVYFDAHSAGQMPHFFAPITRTLESPVTNKEYDVQKGILKEKFIDQIRFLPFNPFVTWNNELKRDILFSATDEYQKKHFLQIKLVTNFISTPRDLLNTFQSKIQSNKGRQVKTKEEALRAADILFWLKKFGSSSVSDGIALLKIFSCGSIVAAIIVCALYKNFYVAVG